MVLELQAVHLRSELAWGNALLPETDKRCAERLTNHWLETANNLHFTADIDLTSGDEDVSLIDPYIR
jgi:hypothetical protein